MKTCFGSIGAARIMDAADRWESGMASWDIGPTPGALTLWRDMRWVSNDIGHRWAWHIGGEEIDRDTARVILRGVLAEETLREFAEWIEDRFPGGEEGDERDEVLLDEIFDKMRELGMVPCD